MIPPPTIRETGQRMSRNTACTIPLYVPYNVNYYCTKMIYYYTTGVFQPRYVYCRPHSHAPSTDWWPNCAFEPGVKTYRCDVQVACQIGGATQGCTSRLLLELVVTSRPPRKQLNHQLSELNHQCFSHVNGRTILLWITLSSQWEFFL